jgi:hypothetical protein
MVHALYQQDSKQHLAASSKHHTLVIVIGTLPNSNWHSCDVPAAPNAIHGVLYLLAAQRHSHYTACHLNITMPSYCLHIARCRTLLAG